MGMTGERPQPSAGRPRQEQLRLRDSRGVEEHLPLASLGVEQAAPEALAVDGDVAAGDARGDRLAAAARTSGRSTSCQPISSAGTARIAARKRMPSLSAARAGAGGSAVQRGRVDDLEGGARERGRACAGRRSTSAGRERRRRTSPSRCRPRSSRSASAPRARRAPGAGSRRCRTSLQPQPRAHRRQRRVGERAREVARRPDVRPPRARDGEAERVVDPARRHLVVAREPGQDREPGGVGRRPAGGAHAVRAQVPDRARPGRPAAADPAQRVELVEPAGVAVDDEGVAVAVRARRRPRSSRRPGSGTARGRTRRRTRTGRRSSPGPCRRP